MVPKLKNIGAGNLNMLIRNCKVMLLLSEKLKILDLRRKEKKYEEVAQLNNKN